MNDEDPSPSTCHCNHEGRGDKDGIDRPELDLLCYLCSIKEEKERKKRREDRGGVGRGEDRGEVMRIQLEKGCRSHVPT